MNIMSLRSRIGGLIAGWVFSMIVALVTGMIKRAVTKQQQRTTSTGASSAQPRTKVYGDTPRPAAKPETLSSQPYKTWAITDTIYQGMTLDELKKAYGEPTARMRVSDTSERWTYGGRTSANDNGMTVTIESGLVTDWTETASTTL